MYYTDDTSKLLDPPEEKWKPVYWTPRKYKDTLGDSIIEFVEKNLTPPRKYNDEDFKLLEWQKWLYRHIFELKPNGKLRYKEVYIQVPRKNGKSMIMSHSMLYWLTKGKSGDELYLAAKDSNQAQVLFHEIARNIDSSPGLSLVLHKTRDRIKNNYKDIRLRKLSSSAKSTFGLAPFISVGDELCMWDGDTGTSTKGQEMITSLTTGSGDRPEYMFIGITTAGSNTEGIAYSRYEKGKLVANGEAEDDAFGFFCWEAEEFDDISEESTWLKANPSMAEGVMKIENFRDEYKSQMLNNPAEFERYRLNKWIKGSALMSYMLPNKWREAARDDLLDIPDGAEVVLGFDGSVSNDSTGIVGIDVNTGLMQVLHKWEKPKGSEEWYVDVDEVMSAMEDVFSKYDVKKLYCDPSYFQASVKKWIVRFGSNKVRDIPQSVNRMRPMSDDFLSDVYGGKLFHNNDRRFTQHVMNAVMRENGTPGKESRNSFKKIDFLVCSILANGARREWLDEKTKREKMAARYSN